MCAASVTAASIVVYLLAEASGEQALIEPLRSRPPPRTDELVLYPSRYQSDEVDRNSGMALKLQSSPAERACVWSTQKTLIKCHTYYACGLAAFVEDPEDCPQ